MLKESEIPSGCDDKVQLARLWCPEYGSGSTREVLRSEAKDEIQLRPVEAAETYFAGLFEREYHNGWELSHETTRSSTTANTWALYSLVASQT